MTLCSDNCIPRCDFCIHAIYEIVKKQGRRVIGSPYACDLYNDEEHQKLVESLNYCDDFHCFELEYII